MSLNMNKLIIKNMNESPLFFYNIENDDYVNFQIDIYKNKRKKEVHLFKFNEILNMKEQICKDIKVKDLENFKRCKFIKIKNWYTWQIDLVDIDKDIINFINKLNEIWIKTVFSCQGSYLIDVKKALETWKIQKEGELLAKSWEQIIVLKRDPHSNVIDDYASAYLALEKDEISKKFIQLIKKRNPKFIDIQEQSLWINSNKQTRICLYLKTTLNLDMADYKKRNFNEMVLKNMVENSNLYWNELSNILEEFSNWER